jgi:hypothetical protein
VPLDEVGDLARALADQADDDDVRVGPRTIMSISTDLPRPSRP